MRGDHGAGGCLEHEGVFAKDGIDSCAKHEIASTKMVFRMAIRGRGHILRGDHGARSALIMRGYMIDSCAKQVSR